MMSMRRQGSIDCFSPCFSGAQRMNHHRPRTRPESRRAARSPEEPHMDGPDASTQATRRRSNRRSSKGRAPPRTPSPVCSSAGSIYSSPPATIPCSFYHSFPTRYPSSCEGKRSKSKTPKMELVEEGRQPLMQQADNTPSPSKEGDGGLIKNTKTPDSNPKVGRIGTPRTRVRREPVARLGGDRRLPAVDERGRKKGRRFAGSNVSSGEGYYTDSSGYHCSDYENSDDESVSDNRVGPRDHEQWREDAARRNEMEGKLTAWKQARILKVLNKLKEEEIVIDQWERKKTTMAKMKMKKIEMKLEKKRDRAMVKMQWRIRSLQKKAAKKKVKEKALAAKKMAKVAEAFRVMAVSGKLPWRLVFL